MSAYGAESYLPLNHFDRVRMDRLLSSLSVVQSLDLKYMSLGCSRSGLFHRQKLLTH